MVYSHTILLFCPKKCNKNQKKSQRCPITSDTSILPRKNVTKYQETSSWCSLIHYFYFAPKNVTKNQKNSQKFSLTSNTSILPRKDVTRIRKIHSGFLSYTTSILPRKNVTKNLINSQWFSLIHSFYQYLLSKDYLKHVRGAISSIYTSTFGSKGS